MLQAIEDEVGWSLSDMMVTDKGVVKAMDFFDLESFKIDLKYIHTCSRARDKFPKIKDHTGQAVTYESFKHYNKKWYDKHNDPLINCRIALDCPTRVKKEYTKFWSKVSRTETSLPGILEELRIDKLGIYKHRFHKPPHYNPQHPNRQGVFKRPSRLSQIKNFTRFEYDLANQQLPQWDFITPNMTNDGHDTNTNFAADWAKNFRQCVRLCR
ncbi:hypothetical protein WICPIJ_005873 [Wickerhamomyces pijperi]|uniref:Uncharacterized protein n=1 Tax=Wickerhamomyces pijperi TaxID=599730 RepID=A0A9P8Q4S3_WICPI|nr:hypothetical protein WICPIJ_005873 [Wickerhamomyces pijperi]